jgi:GGDEF domain-containing protein
MRDAEHLQGRRLKLLVPHTNNPIGYASASAGVAVYVPGRHILTKQDLLRQADLALYRAKEMGRNQAVIQEDFN